MAAKRFSGKWTVRQIIIKKHFIVHAYECVPGLQSTLPYSWQTFFFFFFTLAPINLIFISSLSISFFWRQRNAVYDPSFIRYLIYLNLPSHSINKLNNRSRSHVVMCVFVDMHFAFCIIWHCSKNANSAYLEKTSAFFLLVFVFPVTQWVWSPVIRLQWKLFQS